MTSCVPARSVSDTFCAVNGPESTLYFSVALPVLMVSQPSVVLVVKSVWVNVSRPMALNVAASVNLSSPAYSIRISVGDNTSKRACPLVTVPGALSAACVTPPPTAKATPAMAAAAAHARIPLQRPMVQPSNCHNTLSTGGSDPTTRK